MKAEIFTDLDRVGDARRTLQNAIERCANPLQEKHSIKKLQQLVG